jgi:hypothetical protein
MRTGSAATSAGVTPRVLAADLQKRGRDWLYRSARKMREAVMADFEEYGNVKGR